MPVRLDRQYQADSLILWVNLFQCHKMPCSMQGFHLDIGNAAHLDVVQGQCSCDMSDPSPLLKVDSAEIGGVFIDLYAYVSTSPCLWKFDKDIPHVLNTFLKFFQRGLRTTHSHRVIALCEALHYFIHE